MSARPINIVDHEARAMQAAPILAQIMAAARKCRFFLHTNAIRATIFRKGAGNRLRINEFVTLAHLLL